MVRARFSMLTTRIIIAMIGLTLMTALAVAWWTDREMVSAALPGQLQRLEKHAQLMANELDESVHRAEEDALALARSPLVQALAGSPPVVPPGLPMDQADGASPGDGVSARERLEGHLHALLESKPWILQLRIIALDDVGSELVRVDRPAGADVIRTVPPGELQAKGSRDYVRAGRALGPGEVHVTRLEPNQEFGVIERPIVPVVRAVTPVWLAGAERATALVVINLEMNEVLHSLETDRYAGSRIYVVNEVGDYVHHPDDESLEFARAQGAEAPRRWQDDLPVSMAEGQRSPRIIEAPGGAELGVAVVPTSIEDGVLVIETVPYGELVDFARDRTGATLSITLIVLLGALLLGALVSLSLIRPLRRLTLSLERFGPADFVEELPRRGEFGVLSSTLERLADEVEERTKALEAESEARERTLLELTRAEERLRMVMESTPSGLLAVDDQGRIVMVNRAVEQIFGYPRDELMGAPLETLVPEAMRVQHVALRRSFLAAPSRRAMGSNRDLAGLHKSGALVPVEIGLCPIVLHGEITVLASIVDITERREQRHRLEAYAAKLEANNAELEQLAYVVSHDIKSPLRGISTVAQWIAEDFGDVVDEDARENLTLMTDRIERLDRLLAGILDYSRAGRGGLSMTEVATGPVARDVVASLDPPPGIDIRVVEPMPTVMYNDAQLRQLFQNLVDNAIKHMGKPEGTITVACEEREDAWCFSVADDGVGIPARHFGRIFELFQTLHAKEKGASTGAGLAIVKRIVESNGGEVEVESTEGEGACFRFTVGKL